MCGLAGFFCWGESRPEPSQLKTLLYIQQQRGPDAAGIAYVHPDKGLTVIKNGGKPEDFIKNLTNAQWDRVASSPYALMHARQISSKLASADNNDNNHPVTFNGWAATHNGTITNDDDLFLHYKETRSAPVDSIVIPMLMTKGTTVQDRTRNLSTLGGSGTIVIAGPPEIMNGRVIFYRFGRWDLYFLYEEKKEILFWSSFASAQIILGSYPSIGRLRFVPITRLPEDHVLILEPSTVKGEVFELARAPFFRPLARFTTQSFGTIGRTKGLTWTWTRQDNSLIKPPPQSPLTSSFEDYLTYSKNWDTDRIKTQMESKKETYVELPTAFGSYHITYEKDQVMSMVFRGRKSQRKFFRRLENTHNLAIALPASPEAKTKLDNLLTLEGLTLEETDTTFSSVHDMMVCPWCGVWDQRYSWKWRSNRCTFCQIVSR